MFDAEETIKALRVLFDREREERDKRKKRYKELDSFQEEIQEKIDRLLSQEIRAAIDDIARYPPWHSRHDKKAQELLSKADYNPSVFVMTKFPEGVTDEDKKLGKIIEAVSNAVRDCEFVPHIASERQLHSILWDNVELYLVCCRLGIAIIEDRYKPELNPNVALESGWMRGMGKDVLYLMEKDFDHNRADWSGFLTYSFSWDDPEDDIKRHVKQWLKSIEESGKP